RGWRSRDGTLMTMTHTQELANTGVIVTGSSRGVGAATAQLLAQRGAGVVMNYRQKAPRANKVVKQIEEAGGRAVAVGADITTEEGRAAMIAAAPHAVGGSAGLSLNASSRLEAE